MVSDIGHNIPYFTFIAQPQCGDCNSKIDSIRKGEVINFSKMFYEFPECEFISKGEHLFTYDPPINKHDEFIENKDTSNYEIVNQSTLKIEGKEYYAASDGVLVIADKKIEFIPISYDGMCEIYFSDDNSKAFANFYPKFNEGKELTEQDIIKEIKSAGIAVRSNITIIQEQLKKLHDSNQILRDIIVAQGIEPKLGIEGKVDYLFDIKHHSAPVVDENGHIDFYNMNLLESIEKDQPIAIFTATVQGEPGTDVFGKEIPAPKLPECKPPKGKNLYTTEDEPNTYRSKIDGYITYKSGEIIITNEYNIRGDVDFHTGNIISKGTLNVVGNVKTGFKIEMTENIKIGGYVKDSQIKTKGIVNILGGFSGNGDGLIDAGSDVIVRYVRNQTIYSGGDIKVEKEIVDARLYAKGNIEGQTGKMLVIGGYALSAKNIEAKDIGHEFNIATKVEVGHDYSIFDKIKEITVEITLLKDELLKLKEQIEKLTVHGKPISGSETVFKTLLEQFQLRKKKFEALKEKRKILKDTITNVSGSYISASGNIYPGVLIIIDGKQFKVTEIMHNKKFFVSKKEEAIVVTDN